MLSLSMFVQDFHALMQSGTPPVEFVAIYFRKFKRSFKKKLKNKSTFYHYTQVQAIFL